MAFQAQGPVLRRQGLVFKGFELGRDVTLGIFERLAAAVIRRNERGIGMRDFNVKAMHAVEFHFQGSNPGALALTRFERQQKLAAVVLQGAQLIQ